MATKLKPARKQADLFESAAPRPQWEQLPQPVRTESIRLLREMLFSAAARHTAPKAPKGGAHE